MQTGALAAGALALQACGTQKHREENAGTGNFSATARWRMATSWTANFPVLAEAAQRFADTVKAMSGGRFLIEIDAANKHKAPFGVFDLVREGQYEMGHSASYYWKGKDPVLSLFTTVPFGMTANEQNAWFWYGGGNELMDAAYAKHGLLSLNVGNTDMQMGGWFKREIKSLADMSGLKVRVPGLGGEIYARVGAQPVNIPGGELYTALEKNVVDAVEWVGPALDISMGFQQVANFYYTGWQEPAAELQCLINKAKFDQLPPDLQAILRTACKAQSLDMWSEMVYKNAVVWKELQHKYPKVQVRSFPPDVLGELRRQTTIVLDEMAAQSLEVQKVVDSQREFLATVRPWTNMTTVPYLTGSGAV